MGWITDADHRQIAEVQLHTAHTFVDIVRPLVEDYDEIGVLDVLVARTIELLGVDEAVVLLAAPSGQPLVFGASNEVAAVLGLHQIRDDNGPAIDCFRTGEVTFSVELRANSLWRKFGAECIDAGFLSTWAVPLRVSDTTFGCINMFRVDAVSLSPEKVALGQALADVASITISQGRLRQQQVEVEDQLRQALDSRIVIEQAKGMIAERAGIGIDAAFAQLRGFARNSRRALTDTAESVVAGTLRIDTVIGEPDRS